MVRVISLLVDGQVHQPLSVLSLPVLGRISLPSCAMCSPGVHCSPTVFWWWFLHLHVRFLGSLPRQARAEGFHGRSSAAEALTVTEGDRTYVGERKKWVCWVAGDLGHSVSLTYLTSGKKPVARLWTESRCLCPCSAFHSEELSVFSSSCCSCTAAGHAVTTYLLSWIYWHSRSRL